MNRQLEILCQLAEESDAWAITEISKLALRLQQSAEQIDDRDAMDVLGLCYDYGWGVDCDYGEAVKWYQRAKTPNACLKLGICYEQGRGVDRNRLEAHKWYAWSRTSEGFCRMGCLEQEGLGVCQDMTAAAKYYRKASNAGTAHGFYRLAVCYVQGRGVPINFDEAERRFQMAEAQGFIVQ